MSAGHPFQVSLEMQGATLSIVLQVQLPEPRLSAEAPYHLQDRPSATGALESSFSTTAAKSPPLWLCRNEIYKRPIGGTQQEARTPVGLNRLALFAG